MSLGKKVADIGYKSFTVSMLLLTGYGTYLVGRRMVNFMKNKETRQSNANPSLAIQDAAVADSKQ